MSDYQEWWQIRTLILDKALTTELEARVYDPMWLLVRQFQFGEFRHDGGATPIDIAVTLASGQPTRTRAATAAATDTVEIRLGGSPFEAVVEQELLFADGLEGLRTRAESGLFLQRLLRAAGLAPQAIAWALRCPFTLPGNAVVDSETRDWFDTMTGRVPDGRLLSGTVARVIAGQESSIVLVPGELDVLNAWRAGAGIWVHAARSPNWDPEQLEYRLSASAVCGDGEVVLDVPEYVEGTLDWHAFDVGHASLGLTGQTANATLHRIPVPLQFTGMPNNRFWSFEDPSFNFDALELFSRTDQKPSTATMIALEFALSYGDDWSQVPVPLAPHSVCRVSSVVITDCFGDAVSATPPAGRWNLFRNDDPSAPDGLSGVFVNAAPSTVLEGDPIEELHLLRDEQANVAWAVETIVPHPLGGGRPPVAPLPVARPVEETGTSWTMAPTDLPRNWFPLVPITASPGRLAVGNLWTARDAVPGGRVLTELRPSKQLHDDEVPSEGAQITRCWQAARAIDGSLHVWIGRAKAPRQTELTPALVFDDVES